MKIPVRPLILWASAASLAFAAGEMPEIRQVTVYPQADYSPAVSRDGRWLAFVSERSGNPDIWVKRLPNGDAVRITTHEADDLDPAWSQDGKSIVFVSKRRDAEGDLWSVRVDPRRGCVPSGNPVALTNRLGAERRPCFSPAGRKIVYVSGESGLQNLHLLDPVTKKTTPLTRNGGTDPSWSPDGRAILFTSFLRDPGGDIALLEIGSGPDGEISIHRITQVTEGPALDGRACWSPGSDRIAFVRHDSDTDGDGQVTPVDRGHVWVRLWSGLPDSLAGLWLAEFQITSGLSDDSGPFWSRSGLIYFESDNGKSPDIWCIPETGLIRPRPSAAEMTADAEIRFSESETEAAFRQQIVEYRKIPSLFPSDSLWSARAWLRIGELETVLGHDNLAAKAFDRVISGYPGRTREIESALLKKAGLKSESVDDRIGFCRRLIASESADPVIRAEAWILLGDLLTGKGLRSEGFSAYGRVLSDFPRLRNSRGQAQMKIGDLLRSWGQEETARQAWFSVLRELGDVPVWRERAGQRLLERITGSAEEQIAQYRRMIQSFSDYPALMAQAQFAVVDVLMRSERNDDAARELDRVPELVPTQAWSHAEAKIRSAEVSRRRGDELRAIFILESAQKEFGSLEGGRYESRIRESLFNVAFESAERLKNQGDLSLAASRYWKSLTTDPNDIRAHRGYIEIQYRLGRIGEVSDKYGELLRQKPKNAILLYAYGLALSYRGESDPEMLIRSNAALLQSLEEDYRVVYPYRTLGYNYELLENHQQRERTKKQPLATRAVRTLVSPASWLLGALPFRKKQPEAGYLEKAIDALTEAVALNDENADPAMETALTQNLANNFYHLQEFGYARALQHYKRRLDLDTAFSTIAEKAVFHERAGHAALYMDDFEFSARCLETAFAAYESTGREEKALVSLGRLALLRQRSGRYEDAVPIYLKLAQKDENAGRLERLELDYRNVAYNYLLLGEHEDALRYSRKAEALLAERNISPGKPDKNYLRLGLFGFTVPVWGMEEFGRASAAGFTPADELAFVLSLVSRSAEALNRYGISISAEKRRLELFRGGKERLGERISLNRLGLLHFKAASYDSAWRYFSESCEAAVKAGDGAGEWANAVNLGIAAAVRYGLNEDASNVAAAKDILKAALGKSAGPGSNASDPPLSAADRASGYGTLGVLYTILSRDCVSPQSAIPLETAVRLSLRSLTWAADAERQFRTGLELAAGDNRTRSVLLAQSSELDRFLGEHASAEKKLRESRDLLIRLGDGEMLWRAESRLADLLASASADPDSGRLNEAVVLFRSAMDRLELLPIEENTADIRRMDREARGDLYVKASEALVRSGNALEGLRTAERGRQKRLADILLRRPPNLRKERHKIAWGNLRFTRALLSEIRNEILAASALNERPSRMRRLKTEEKKLESDFAAQMRSLENEDGLLAYLAGALPPDAEARIASLGPGEGVLCFLSGPDRTTAWFASADTVAAVVLPLGRRAAASAIQAWTDSLRAGVPADSASRALLSRLVLVFSPQLASCVRITVIPDGALWFLAFDRFLQSEAVTSAVVDYAPSLAFLGLASDRRKINQRTCAMLGQASDRGLAGAGRAAGLIETSRFGPDATETEFKSMLKSADFVDIATWILPNPDDPMGSAIVLQPDAMDDGYFRTEECFSIDATANCVFLPTATGSAGSGWSPELFSWGFLYAGAPSLVWTAWPVRPEIRRVFMQAFYSAVDTLSFASAVREAAAVTAAAHPESRDPAAFRLIGFPGMNSKERSDFASENQTRFVLQARGLEEKAEHADAVLVYEKALSLTEMMGDSTGVARIEQEIVRSAMRGRDWRKAVLFQKRMLARAERTGNTSGLVAGFRNLSVFHMNAGDAEAAAAAKKRQIALLDSLSRNGDAFTAFEDMAFIRAGQRLYREADEWMEKAVNRRRSSGDPAGLARALVLRGRFRLEAEDTWEARSLLAAGVAGLDSLKDRPGAENRLRFDHASGVQLLGLACEKLSRFDEALALQKQGIELFRSLNRFPQTVQGMQYLTNVYWKMGSLAAALEHQNLILDTLRNSGDQKRIGMAYGTLGLIHLSYGDTMQAKIAEQKALDAVGTVPRLQEDRATYLKNLGLIALREDRKDRALFYFTRAMEIDSALNLQSGLAYDRRNIGGVLLALDRWSEGKSLLTKAAESYRGLSDRKNTALSLYGVAIATERSGELREGLALLDSALSESSGPDGADLAWRLHGQKAVWLSRLGRIPEALAGIRAAVDAVESAAGSTGTESFMLGHFLNPQDVYDEAIRLSLDSGRMEEAFAYAERAKALPVVKLLSGRADLFAGSRREWMERINRSRSALLEARSRLARTGSFEAEPDTPDSSSGIAAMTIELNRLDSEHRRLTGELRRADPDLASLVSIDSCRSDDVRLALPDSTALVEYVTGRRELFICVVRKDGLFWRRADQPFEELRDLVIKFRSSVESNLSSDIESRELFHKLVDPIAGDLAGIRGLVIVPHGILAGLPFSALQNASGETLLDSRPISYAPSANAFRLSLARSERTVSGRRLAGSVFAAADPDLGDERLSLPFADKEVRSLRRSFDAVNAFSGPSATRKTFLDHAAAATGVVHFACHASVVPDQPLSSALLLAPAGEDDGRLSATDAFGASLRCGLVALSACETGIGSSGTENGVPGFTWGFMTAGAPSVLSSMWKVDDLASAVLMKRFYRYVKAGQSRAEALRRAQLLVRNAVDSHPSAWAAFGLNGEFR
ncbi:CHAT domain-containing protein [bacterium]|nr:CHAT domain-containing protein [bacterium]